MIILDVFIFLATIVILVTIAALTGAFDFRHAEPPEKTPAEQQRPETWATPKAGVAFDYRTHHSNIWRK